MLIGPPAQGEHRGLIAIVVVAMQQTSADVNVIDGQASLPTLLLGRSAALSTFHQFGNNCCVGAPWELYKRHGWENSQGLTKLLLGQLRLVAVDLVARRSPARISRGRCCEGLAAMGGRTPIDASTPMVALEGSPGQGSGQAPGLPITGGLTHAVVKW